MAKPRVFLSYARKDAEWAKELAGLLVERGAEPLDPFGSSGSSLTDAISQAAAQAEAFVFLLGSGKSVDRWQQMEWHEALRSNWDSDEGRPMIPVLAEGAVIPPFLRNRIAISSADADSNAIADRIIDVASHPETSMLPSDPAQAASVYSARVAELQRFAEAIESSQAEMDRF
ncbi:MAG: toll/interleukin-1 receptor domain-containing protein [Acidobacteriaceae bacterium]|nr:toll/interleukin-1 receptor domain-containing protein [Acidobacteriaceae bacterium]MBV9037127.1 toll/interleukin-1 receptor domain-containing protein [Acidobacteriaceae bacterium]